MALSGMLGTRASSARCTTAIPPRRLIVRRPCVPSLMPPESVGAAVHDDEERGAEVGRQARDELAERLHTSRRGSDHDDVAPRHILVVGPSRHGVNDPTRGEIPQLRYEMREAPPSLGRNST